MGRIEKDKNFLMLWVDGKEKPYKYNINTGELIGLKGKAISSIPQGLVPLISQNYTMSNAVYYLYSTMRWGGGGQSTLTHLSDNNIAELLLCDRLDNIGYPFTYRVYENISQFSRMVSDTPACFAQFVAYFKAHPIDTALGDWIRENAKRLWMAQYHIEINTHLTAEMVNWLYQTHSRFKPEEIPFVLYWLPRYLWDFYHGRPSIGAIQNIFGYAEQLGVTLEPKCDFFRTYINLRREYCLRKAELDDKAVKAMADKHRKALTFENEDYIVVIPETAQAIIDEGKNQSNCVGSYVTDVVKGYCNIVFVRKKTAPDTSYITVEVSPKGHIRQYLRTYNRRTDGADRDFYELFQQHLSTHWGE